MTLLDAAMLWFIAGGLVAALTLVCLSPEHQEKVKKEGGAKLTFAIAFMTILWPIPLAVFVATAISVFRNNKSP